jgi:DHA2 family multidrug resistance protein-like MFS transporter
VVRHRLRLLPGAQPESHHGQRAAHRAGGASGIVATARLIGQATGAALVAYCSPCRPRAARSYALVLAAVFAGAASIASFARLAVASAAPE